MSAELTQHAPVRLLIAESSENSAQEFDSLLRDAGIATRMQLIDLATASDAMSTADLMLCDAGLPQLEQLLPKLKIKAPHVPIILINHAHAEMTTSQGMRLGAADVVSKSDPDELVLVFKRELEHVCQGQRMSELHQALMETEQRCQLLLQSAQAAIAYVHEGMHIYANAGYLELFGFEDADSLMGLPLMDLVGSTGVDVMKSELKKFRQQGEARSFEFQGHSTRGDAFRATMTLAAAEYEGEPCTQVTIRPKYAPPQPPSAASEDQSGDQEEAAIQSNAREAEEQVPNGNSSNSGISAFLDSARSMLESVHPHRVILVAQIDGFAKLQENCGLRDAEQVSGLLHAKLQDMLEDRPCARLSPHQFAFSLTDTDRSAVTAKAEAMRSAVEALLLEASEKTVRITISIGGAELDTDGDIGTDEVLEQSLNTAFATALRNEQDCGNSVEILSKEVAREEPNSVAGQILALINDAIDNHRFVLLFQPIISLRGDSDEHYEVFLRMHDRDDTEMVPSQFLRTAIDHGVAGKIDRWVILQSIKMLSTHRAKGHNTRLTINLTANSISDPDFLQWLGVAIKTARLPSDAVIFQITEEDASGLVRQAKELVDGLRAMHFRVSLSRFGLIDKSLELLDHLAVDFVKIDGSRIESMLEDSEGKQSVADMIQNLQSAGKLTIIPMVESATLLSALWQAGANYIQGHYLQEPSTELNYDFTTDD
jgi:EAL domain-containing protein (putative c-di-GMP-specific phosphodiesterase class I)/GGDEF domain-containing protein/DNA-binding NarL/FixJ family response regulator